MDPRLSSVAAIIAKSTELATATLAGIDDAAYRRAFLPGTSPMAWILGHLVNSRHGMARLLGGDDVYAHAALTARGSSSAEPGLLPDLDATLAVWQRLDTRLAGLLDAASAGLLDAPAPGRAPSLDGTVLGTLTFLALHECHLGQLGMLRKAAGLPGLAG
ncbi:MAG: DinB family protein [Candidatus Krumholzibacteriia bacterium]